MAGKNSMNDKFVIHYAAQSNMGLVRDNNEDNLFLDGEFLEGLALLKPFQSSGKVNADAVLFSVCDGMGGEEYGEEASLIAVKVLKNNWSELVQTNTDFASSILKCINEINDRICRLITLKGKRMGTTLALIAFKNNKISVVNIGDSRIYLYRNNILKQISIDHTQVQTLIRSGAVSPSEVNTHPSRNKLTQHLGIFHEELVIEPYTLLDQGILENDQWLICSDGLTDMLNDIEIKEIFDQSDSEIEICDLLIRSALKKGGKDNVTVIILKASKKKIVDTLSSSRFIFSINKSEMKNRLIKLFLLILALLITVSLTVYIIKKLNESKTNINSFKSSISVTSSISTIASNKPSSSVVSSKKSENTSKSSVTVSSKTESSDIAPTITSKVITSSSITTAASKDTSSNSISSNISDTTSLSS